MPSCGAIDCTNRGGNVSLHRLPDDKLLAAAWIKNIKRKGTEHLAQLRICSEHFEEDCFLRDYKSELLGTRPKAMLKPGAIPTIFSFVSKKGKRKSSERRDNVAANKQLILDAEKEARFEQPMYIDQCVGNHMSTKTKSTQISDESSISKRDIAVNTELSFSPDLTYVFLEDSLAPLENGNNSRNCQASETSSLSGEEDEEDTSSSYHISSDMSQEENNSSFSDDCSSTNNPLEDKKFIVFWSALIPLLTFCFTCKSPAYIKNIRYKGSALIVTMFCISNHLSTWCSQPKINGTYAGNFLLPAAILFTGGTFYRFLEVFDIFGLKFFAKSFYYRIQREYLFPCIHKFYQTYQQILIDQVKTDPINIIGDGRCDSPGYCAKYGTYTIMDLLTNKILHFYVVHVGTVGNSNKMEKQGLIKCLDKMGEWGVNVRSLTTDRHIQIKKYMREVRDDIVHQFDIWHFSKNIKKALTAAASKKECSIIGRWTKSITNHFWWCCMTSNGDVENLREKWKSILFHVSNIHEWDGFSEYQRCCHKQLTEEEKLKKDWIKFGTKAYFELETIVYNKKTLADLKYCTEFHHTGNLEVYHSVYTKFCPKRNHFSMMGMIARSQLAILSFNSTANTPIAKSKEGKLKLKHQYSRVTNSWVVKTTRENNDKDYLYGLMKEAVWLKESGEEVNLPELKDIPENIAPSEKPSMEETINSRRSRFSNEQINI